MFLTNLYLSRISDDMKPRVCHSKGRLPKLLAGCCWSILVSQDYLLTLMASDM